MSINTFYWADFAVNPLRSCWTYFK